MIAPWLGANWKLRRVLSGMGQSDRDLSSDLICPNGSDVRTMGAVRVKGTTPTVWVEKAGVAIPMRQERRLRR